MPFYIAFCVINGIGNPQMRKSDFVSLGVEKKKNLSSKWDNQAEALSNPFIFLLLARKTEHVKSVSSS